MRPGQAAAGAVKPIPVYGRPGLAGQLTQYPAQGRERLQPERLTGWLQALVRQLPQGLPSTLPDPFQAQQERERVQPLLPKADRQRFCFVP